MFNKFPLAFPRWMILFQAKLCDAYVTLNLTEITHKAKQG